MTKKTLAAQLIEAHEATKTSRELRELDQKVVAELRTANRNLTSEIEGVRSQFDDLKKRLFDAEQNVARLQGYVDRVKEDDIVREDLIPTGNEDEQTLVPKRKFLHTARQIHLEENSGLMGTFEDRYEGRPRKPKKHWVNY